MKYCVKCVMPDTKPDLHFNKSGVCDACSNFSDRGSIDWEKRKKELLKVVDSYKNESNWDCIVPVSGGKDSTFQVIKMLQLGIKPLCVTSTTCDLTTIGRKNIENIKSLGVDYIEFTPNPSVRKKLNRIGLQEVGDISWPEHLGIFTIPVQVAVNYKIPLIVWGENSQNEYGGPAVAKDSKILNRQWLEEFGGLLGLRTRDMSDSHGIDTRDLMPYTYPTDEELEKVGVSGIFLGYFIPWDGLSNALISKAWGFSTSNKTISGSMVDYENLDNYQTGIHDYFKYLKFGFSRASDIASMHIRRGRITREDAMEITYVHDGKYPFEYLGKTLEEILEPIEIELDEFDSICDRFTNKQIFKLDEDGNILKDKNKRPIKLSYDN